MARRSGDWNEGLAQDLRDREFAREFLLAAMDEDVPIQIALGKVIRAMGVKEFAGKVRMASPNVLRAISTRHNPTQDTLNRLLKPFRLKLSLARPTGRRVAMRRRFQAGTSSHLGRRVAGAASRYGRTSPPYVIENTVSVSQRRNDSLSLNCLNSSVSSFSTARS